MGVDILFSLMDDETKEELNEAWGLYDKNNSGSMPAKNFGYVLRYLGQNPSDQQVLDLCQKHGSGQTMTKSGYMTMMTSKTQDVSSEQGVIEAFQVFDKDGNGQISAAELRNVLTNLGDRLSDEQVHQMMNEALASDEGNLDYKQFVRTMINR